MGLEERNGKGKVFVCGNSALLEAVATSMKWVFSESEEADAAVAEDLWEELRNSGDRYASDIFD